MSTLAEEAREILAETLRQVNVHAVVRRHLSIDDGVLTMGGASVGLLELDEIVIIAVGKAALPMCESACEALGGCGLGLRGVVVTNENRPAGLPGMVVLPGHHPLPDAVSLQAAQAVLALLRSVRGKTAVLFLISGGASAMLEAPLDPAISLEDTAAFYQALIGSGLPISQMNALRKHFSAVKGGRLAEAAAPAGVQCSLLISDVPVNMPDVIGSGPSLPDPGTLADCRELLARVELPESVAKFFNGPLCVETLKPEDSCFERSSWHVILSSEHLAEAAMHAARSRGFHVEVDNTCDEWEYRDAARYLLERGEALARRHVRCCLVSVGEVGVTLTADAGVGGRNQQFALWCATEMARLGLAATVLSAGSDGIDGNSQAAGAVCDETTSAKALRMGLDPQEALERFDSAPLLKAVGAAVMTGPTGNNLRDLRLMLFEE